LRQGECLLQVNSDASVRSFQSLKEKRALFGYEQVWLYKVQAGIVVHAQKVDWSVRPRPRSVQFAGKIFDGIEALQLMEFHRGASQGYVRRIRLRNGSGASIMLRVLALHDPTSAHYRDDPSQWGSLGFNAFNRQSHVAMDEVSDPPSARVIGTVPAPARFYMTTAKTRAQGVVGTGELPEGTAGMSGQVLIMSTQDLELAPGETKELALASIYSPGKLEEALSEFGKLQSGETSPRAGGPFVACSDQALADSATWALTSLEGGAFVCPTLDRFELTKALSWVNPKIAKDNLARAKEILRSDGSVPHSVDQTKPGVLETSVLLQGAAYYIALSQDKKVARSSYPVIKKLAQFLIALSNGYTVVSDPSLPQGWRRHIGSGYPTGEIPEISLAVAGALAAAAQVARMVSKSEDAGKFRDRSEMVVEQAKKRLMDERGFPVLCRDTSGQVRSDESIDIAVAVYRHPLPTVAQGAAHRMLEKDFDTPYGPRCVPTSNMVYFNGSYGQGELGGVRPRAVLAHAIVCYRTGLSGIGSLTLSKVARLVTDEASRLGGSPGGFPEWIDVEGGDVHGEGSDPVAAARYIEGIVEGELGLTFTVDRAALSPPENSALGWLMASDLWAGEPVSAFLGRGEGKAHLFFSAGKVGSAGGTRFAKSERLDLNARGVHAISFYNPGQIICMGNSTLSQAKVTLSFSPKSAELTQRLTTPLEVYDPSKGIWTRTASLRVAPTMSFDAQIDPNGWKAFRVSNG
jgi:hypothetical protein